MKRLSEIEGVKAPRFVSAHFKEFVVDFNDTEKSVSQINRSLLKRGIFGGKDLNSEFPDLDQCALYCVTEIHSKEDIDSLVDALADCLSSKDE
jgi:glycine dehydrogenase subunit 1